MNKSRLNLILVLPDFFDSTMPARPAVLEIYGKYLPNIGHKVSWIALSKNGNAIKRTTYGQVVVYLVPYNIYSSFISKFKNFVRFYIKEYTLLSELLCTGKYDVVQVRNDVFAAIIVLYMKRKHKNVLFTFQYSFPTESFVFQSIGYGHYYYYFAKIKLHILKYIFKNADFVFPISKWMELKLIEQGIDKSKMMPLPMGVNPELFDFKKDGSSVRQKYLPSDSKLLLYLGSMDKLRSLEILIYSFLKVKKIYPNTKMLMVGDGNDRERLEKLSADLGLHQNVIFTGQVPYFDVPTYISASDICLSPINPLDLYKVSSPTKLFESLVMRKPVVANKEIPEQKEVLEQSSGGILVEFQPESFANGIIQLLQNPEIATKMGENGYKWIIENRSYESMAHAVEKQYFKLLESIGGL